MNLKNHRPALVVVLSVVVITGLIALYLLTLPRAETHRTALATPPARTSEGDQAAQASAERYVANSEKSFNKADKRGRASDTLIDACTGKPIPAGAPTHDITSHADCAAPSSKVTNNRQTNDGPPPATVVAPPAPRPQPAAGLTPAEWKRANSLALAAATYCLRLSQQRSPSKREIAGEVDAVFQLPDLLRKDPDTYHRSPGTSQGMTMRQLVGETRDGLANYQCDDSGAQTLNTALETLPPSH